MMISKRVYKTMNLRTALVVGLFFICLSMSYAQNTSQHINAAEWAIKTNDKAALKKLLKNGLEPNAITTDKTSLLHVAVDDRNLAMVNILLDNGAKDTNGTTLDLAIRIATLCNSEQEMQNQEAIVKTLLNHSEPLSIPPEFLKKLFLRTSFQDSTKIMEDVWNFSSKVFLRKNLDIKQADLYLGPINKPKARYLVKIMLDAGVPVKYKEPGLSDGSPLYLAAACADLETVKLFIEHGVNPNWTGPTRAYPLHAAANKDVYKKDKSREVILYLLESGADPLIKDKRSFNFFDYLDVSDPEFSNELREKFKVAKVPLEEMSPGKRLRVMYEFLEAIRSGDKKTVKEYLDKGWDPNIMHQPPYTILSYAAKKNQAGIVQLLLDEGADVNGGERGYTALYEAAEAGAMDSAKVLIAAGANINLATKDNNRTPLQAAIRGKQKDMIDYLKSQGASTQAGNDPNVMLHSTAQLDTPDYLIEVLKNGADPNALDASGNSALFNAAALGNLKTMKALLEAGADPNLKLKSGGSAVFAAARGPNHSKVKPMVELMLKHGLDLNIKHSGDSGFDTISVNYPDYAKELRAKYENKD